MRDTYGATLNPPDANTRRLPTDRRVCASLASVPPALLTREEPAMYERTIRETMARMGRVGAAEPRWVEAWMRGDYGTLDHLGGALWDRAVREALECALASTAEFNERLAESWGLGVGRG